MGEAVARCYLVSWITTLNISKLEQRVLHVLSQGGAIEFCRNDSGKVVSVTCYNRDGHILSDCKLSVFNRLKKRGFIRSQGGKPYRITRSGILAVRPQFDNR